MKNNLSPQPNDRPDPEHSAHEHSDSAHRSSGRGKSERSASDASKHDASRHGVSGHDAPSDRSIGSLIDHACDAFEQKWTQGETPDLDDYLWQIDPPHAEPFFRELFWIELSYRQKAGASSDLDHYLDKYAQFSATVEEVYQRFQEKTRNDTTVFSTEDDLSGESVACQSDYTELSFLAQGGLGQVYEAEDGRLKRRVAVKFLRRDLSDDAEAGSRFRIEAEVTSRLDHPGVVPVHAIGQNESGRPFYVMRLIDGSTFRHAIEQYHRQDKKAAPSESVIRLHDLVQHLISACQTVAYAHNRGVLHRDIKPDNIMLGKYGETLIVDWGLVQFVERDDRARASGEKTLMPGSMSDSNSSSNAAAGTIGYISPEQTPGNLAKNGETEVGPATDVYSLGATLYCVLTGSAPFHHQQGRTVWEKIREGSFPRPRLLNPACPADLEAICLKAMQTDPADRYGSAMELAADLQRWLADEPVSVRRQSPLEQTMRFTHKHRTGTLMVAASVVALAIFGLLFAVVQSQLASQLADKAETETRLREQVDVTRLANLQTAARFAANGLGNELDSRFNALYEAMYEADAQGKTLYDLVSEAEGKDLESPEVEAIQRWINRHSSQWVAHRIAESWFVNDRQCVNLARNPWGDSIGQTFFYRSYFQDRGYDLIGEDGKPVTDDPADVQIIRNTTLSQPYVGTVTGQLKVVFSVPIRKSPDDEPIGILGMGADLGEQINAFTQDESGSPNGANGMPGARARSFYMLVNLRKDSLEGVENLKTGVVIKHPLMKPGTKPYRIDPRVVEQASKEEHEFLDERFVDPLAPDQGERPAAIAKIRIDSRDASGEIDRFAKQIDSGWAVIVQDQPLTELSD